MTDTPSLSCRYCGKRLNASNASGGCSKRACVKLRYALDTDYRAALNAKHAAYRERNKLKLALQARARYHARKARATHS